MLVFPLPFYTVLTLLSLLLPLTTTFTFSSLSVTATTKTINTITTYTFDFDRTIDDNNIGTNYQNVTIGPSDLVKVFFPTGYVLGAVSCSMSVDGGSWANYGCGVLEQAVVVSGVVAGNTPIGKISLEINNILNPAPAFTTDYFTGSIGSDISGPGSYASNIILQPAQFTSCYSTFNSSTVNSTADMLIKLTPKNQIPSSGYIILQFPTTRRWVNDISFTNYLPINPVMSCSNKSLNVLSGIQCTGDTFWRVTATGMFGVAINSVFMFSVNNFLSPPTNQQSDVIVTTSYSGDGYKIDTCDLRVSDLTPKLITSFTIASSTGTAIVNQNYTLKFSFILTDTFSQTDVIKLVFPTGSTVNFSSTTVSTNFSSSGITSSYQPSSYTLTLTINNPQYTFNRNTLLVFNAGTYRAPPSIQATSNFLLTVYRNNYPKLQGTATFAAGASTVTGSVTSILSTTVNANTTYTFQITLADSISNAGRIRIIFPAAITILATSTSCATITGTNTTLTPTCTYNTTQNSITLSSLNSSSSPIDPQSLTISISGLKNPSSTSPTGAFAIRTYYRSVDTALVAVGTMAGVTATPAVIDNNLVVVGVSSYVVYDVGVTYTLQCRIVNPIPAGGYFTILIPPQIYTDTTSTPNSCSLNLNSTSFSQTPCTATLSPNSTGTLINFTNPFTSDATINTVFIARISSAFRNPTSTRPTSSFKLFTYSQLGFLIAYVDTAITVQMVTPGVFGSVAVTRLSNRNYDLNTYTFAFSQPSPYQASSLILVTFPTNVIPTSNSTCLITTPTSTSLQCTYTSPTMKVTLPSSTIAGSSLITLKITNIHNPSSFQPTGQFTLQTKTPNELYSYSLQSPTPNLTNTIPTTFQSLTYTFTPSIYSQPSSLQLNFNPTDTAKLPAKLRLTLANSFVVGNLTCNGFVDFVGTCAIVGVNTVEVVGGFTNALMSFSVTGFLAPSGPVSDYSIVDTFDANNYKMDQSTNVVLFTIGCTMPCRTCPSASQPTTCLSCYSQPTITPNIYLNPPTSQCLSSCPPSRYLSIPTSTCLACDTNCLTCNNTATFCLTCSQNSTYKYLYVDGTVSPSTQVCVAGCPARMYADVGTGFVCVGCVAPCVGCTGIGVCLSCVSGRYLLGTACLTSCPTGTYIQNPSTNTCDPCNSTCLTCTTQPTTCTSCTPPLLLYQSQCRSTCPSPLVPQNNTCGPCDTSCLTCINDPYNCTSCNTTSTLAYLLNWRCLATCPENYYRNIGIGACSLCSGVVGLNCDNCSSGSSCFSCNVGFVLFNGSCLNYVPPGYVNISGVARPCTGDCATCSITQSNCTSCLTTNLLNFTCYPTCPTGYLGLTHICQPCLSPCRSCTTNTTTCTSCLSTLTPAVYLSNGRCIPTCPDGTYANNVNSSCVGCVAPCQFCRSDALCLSCLNGFYLSLETCVAVCPVGTTGVNRLCRACQGNCATCVGVTTYCTSCKPLTYLYQLNNSCVTSCGTGLFISPTNQTCIYCSSPCKTCTNTSTTCLSCLTGYLHSHQCISSCPAQYFNQLGICQQCPTQCSACYGLANCTGCVSGFVLYNGGCVGACPATYAVVVGQVCTMCSGASCHQCNSADICTMCDSSYSLLNGACLNQCPASYKSNGTHCIDINQEVLTTPNSFPVPFSIAAAVIVLACLMSKLQFSKTFLPGAIFGFFGVLEVGALGFFLYLYYQSSFTAQPLPFFIGSAAIAYLYLLNILASLIQNLILCSDKQFLLWYSHTPNKISTFLLNLFSLTLTHKVRNIMFCKLFTFAIFSAQLQSISKFKVMNIFSFLSLLASGAAMFAVGIAFGFAEKQSQLYYQCVDVIVVTGVNAILAFFNVMKGEDFFYQLTPEGYELKRKIKVEDEFYGTKLQAQGKDIEDEQGYLSQTYHVQGSATKSALNTNLISTQGFQTKKYQLYDVSSIQDESFGSLAQQESQKKFEDISIQAVEMIDDKSFAEPEVKEEPKQESAKPFEITVIAGHDKSEENCNFTTIFNKSDKGVGVSFSKGSQIGIQNTIDHGPSLKSQAVGMTQYEQPSLHDISVQPTYKRMIDESVQRYDSIEPVDRSVQRTVFFRQDQSMQYASSMKTKPPSLRDISVDNMKPSVKDQSVSYEKVSMKDQSVSYQKIPVKDQSVSYDKVSMKDKSVSYKKASVKDQSIQQAKSMSNKSIMQQPSLINKSNQIQPQNHDQQTQNIPQIQSTQIQAVQAQSDKANQQQISIKQKSIQHEQSIRNKSVQHSQVVQFDQYTQEMQGTTKNQEKVGGEDEEDGGDLEGRGDGREEGLREEKKDQFLLPKEEIRNYQEELEQRIRDKERELNQIKRKVQMQQRKNQQKSMKLNNQPKYFDQTHRTFQKQSRTDRSLSDNPTLSLQQHNPNATQPTSPSNPTTFTNLNRNTSNILKKQVKQIQEEVDAEIDKTLEQIQVIDDQGKERVIKVQVRNGDEEDSRTQKEFLGMLEEHPSKVIFDNSEEQDEGQENVVEVNQGFVRSKNVENKEDIKQLIKNVPKKTPQFYQSDAQISSGKQGSTNIHSISRPIPNIKKANSKTTNNPKFQFEDSQDNSYDPIITRPTNPYQPHSYSDMSQTIQQMHPNLNQTTSTTYLKNDSVKNRIKEMLPGSNTRFKKDVPAERSQRNQEGVRRRFQSSSNTQIPQTKKMEEEKGARKSSLMLVGKSQFTEEGLARKQLNRASPLKVVKRWEYENEDRNILQSGGEEEVVNTRAIQSRLVPPIQTDKQVFGFKTSRVQGTQKVLVPNPRREVQYEQNYPVVDQISPFIGQFNLSSQPQKPILRNKQSQNFECQDFQAEPYIEQQPSIIQTRYKNNIILDQMLDRPANSQLNSYYNQKKRRSSEKQNKNGQFIDFQSETQKIYQQKLSAGKKK